MRELRRQAVIVASLLASLALPACVYPTAPIDWDRWRASFPDHAAVPVEEKVARIEAHLIDRHLAPTGVLVYRRPDVPFDAGTPEGYTNLADEPIWTGCLVAAWAFKYSVTGDPADRELLLRALRGLEFLRRVTGKPGLLARGVAPAGITIEPRERPHQEWRPGAPGFEGWRYRGDVSKDQYFGALFGYTATTVMLDLRPDASDVETYRLVRDATTSIADHIWENGLRIVDIDGETTRFGDLDGWYGPIPIGPNAEISLAWQLLAWRLTGEEQYRERYDELVDQDYPCATDFNKFQFLGRTNHNNDVMAAMGLYSLCVLETDPELLSTYRASLEDHWSVLRNEANLLYHAAYVAGCGKELPPGAAQDVSETLRLFPVDLRLRPVDITDHPAVERAFLDGRKGAPRNRTALPLHVRPISSFVWKSSPYALVGNGREGMTASGVDFLLGYWMSRRYGLVNESPEAGSKK